jgi:hypothetical protein
MEFRESELGRLLAAAHGYQVLSAEGRSLGVIEHLRYAQHADHPDELVVRLRNRLWGRRRCLSFSAVRAVDPDLQQVVLGLTVNEANASPQA